MIMRWAFVVSLVVVPLALFGCGAADILKLIWPNRFSLNKQFEVLQDAGCSGFCALNGFGDGFVIGTGPICEATCANDCPGHACISPLPGSFPVNGSAFMPDAGALCANTAVTLASEVFKDSDESILDMYKDVHMEDGKSCCCQTRLPMQATVIKDEPTPKGTFSCDDWCQGGGYGHGITIGTAPACGATCNDDCAGSVCATSNDFFNDHGHHCLSGDKVCCCAHRNDNSNAAEAWKDVKDWWSPPPKMPSSFSCADFCDSGGWGGGEVIGTAPRCDASCSGDCAGRKCVTLSSGFVTDYGHDCTLGGDKVCCCEKGSDAMATISKTVV